MTFVAESGKESKRAMVEVSVYYCWGCDAHRRVPAEIDGKVHCPRCDRELTPDAKLPLRVIQAEAVETVRRPNSPSPVRPRFAASA